MLQKILSLLPGGNCAGFGGCGKATCQACAEAIAAGESVALCPACSQETVDAIAEAVNRTSVEIEEQIAFIACGGDAAGKERLAVEGCKSCKDAVAGGFARGECKNGCTGIGDCVNVCLFGAMEIENNSIRIDRDKCNGCGACANAAVYM